ncbi:hypothetical protein VP01_2576g2 [Puccinia sorghi]|uniref:Uncharacterized protein n=1 Tax=Puccinia sorghi TaxID=27349 RepID=A0A0L6V5I5_9BASI|nr:hypothetical protein VP01_2576g2 [Puccinia sorghi]
MGWRRLVLIEVFGGGYRIITLIVVCGTTCKSKQHPINSKHYFFITPNFVERTFGVWKKRFLILTHALDYSIKTQCNLVFSLGKFYTTLLLITAMLKEMISSIWEQAIYLIWARKLLIGQSNKGASTEAIQLRGRDKQLLWNWRDGIAEDKWAQYQDFLSARIRHRRAN